VLLSRKLNFSITLLRTTATTLQISCNAAASLFAREHTGGKEERAQERSNNRLWRKLVLKATEFFIFLIFNRETCSACLHNKRSAIFTSQRAINFK
jgi:hypothetical protein